MNKKILHLITNKLPIISLIILILAYVYLSIPNNYTLQVGGVAIANTVALPKNIPWKYKYRWVLVLLPFLLIIYIIYAAFLATNTARLSLWDVGTDFFSQFQINVKKTIDLELVKGPDAKSFNYKDLDPTSTDDINVKKLFNIIKLTADSKSGLNKEAQYFCNTLRQCNCCSFPAYITKFPTMKETCKKFQPPSS